MGAGISLFLISAAAGYWVLARSSGENGWVKTLGRFTGILIILISFLSIPASVRQMQNSRAAFARPGAFPLPSAPYRRPAAPELPGAQKPPVPAGPSQSAPEKGSGSQ